MDSRSSLCCRFVLFLLLLCALYGACTTNCVPRFQTETFRGSSQRSAIVDLKGAGVTFDEIEENGKRKTDPTLRDRLTADLGLTPPWTTTTPVRYTANGITSFRNFLAEGFSSVNSKYRVNAGDHDSDEVVNSTVGEDNR